MSHHYQLAADAIMNHITECKFNEKKQRFEALASGIKNIGYGTTKLEALKMFQKIVDNHVRKRPELENVEEHENYGKDSQRSSMRGNVNNVFHNVGVVNTGDLSNIDNVTISVHQSLDSLQHSNEAFAAQLKAFVKVVQESDLAEQAKLEVLDRADLITIEAAKPADKRLLHRITDNVKGIGDALKGVAALKAVFDLLEKPIHSYFGL